MPPKGSKKPKAEMVVVQPPTTPEKQTKLKVDTPKKTPAKATPRKKKEDQVLNFKSLGPENSCGAPLQVEIGLDGESKHAEQGKSGGWQKILKLSAANNFTVAKTFMVEDGQYEGYQVVYIKPTKPFRFGELPEEMRTRVYRYYFANKGVVDEPITFDGKRTATKEAYAKTYAQSSKNRVALLATSKEIYNEAVDVFYAKPLRFDTPQTLIDFLGQVVDARPRLCSIEIHTYNKLTARNALTFLSEAKNLKRLHFETGVFSEADPKKAAKIFWETSFRLLKAMSAGRTPDGEERDPASSVDILSFAKGAFTYKDDQKKVKNWDEQMVEEFKEELRKKLR